MKIVTCIKQVPDKDTRFEINAQGTWIKEQDLTYQINECDEFALEEALRLKEKHGGEVILLSAGGPSVEKSLRKGLAMGADRAILVQAEREQLTDPLNVARALQAQIETEAPDLVLAGVRSDDHAFAQTGTMMAQLLDWPHATIVMKIETLDEGRRLRIQRELEAGLLEEVELPLPAVLTVQQGINQIRYASLKGIMSSKKKEIRNGPWPTDSAGSARHVAIRKISFPVSEKKSEMIGGNPKEAAQTLVERMKKEMKIL